MLPNPDVFKLLIEFARLQFVQKPLKFPGIALLSALRMADRLTHNAGQNNFPFSQLSASPYPLRSQCFSDCFTLDCHSVYAL